MIRRSRWSSTDRIGMSHALMLLAVLTMFAVMRGIPRDLMRAAETLAPGAGRCSGGSISAVTAGGWRAD
jgi:hypothetical protein